MDINKTSYIDWSTVPHCQIQAGDFRRFSLEVGDVCVVRMADPGKVGIVEEPVEAVFASYLVRLRSRDPRLRPQTLFHFLDSPEYQARITASSTGATRRSASAGVLTEPEIVLPPQGITEDFERRAATVRGQLAALVRLNASVARTRDLLLPRLVSGRLDISDVDLGTLTPAQEAA
jgi:type I restriction enzyme S subunit